MNTEGVDLEKAGRPCDALERYRAASDLGGGKGAANAARILFAGRCGDADVPMAVSFMTLAARRGEKTTQRVLASLYLDGKHVSQDIYLFHYWARRALSLGSELLLDDSLEGLSNQVEDMIAQRNLTAAATVAGNVLKKNGYDIAYPAFKHALVLYGWDVGCSYFGVLPAVLAIDEIKDKYCGSASYDKRICEGYYSAVVKSYQPKIFSSVPCIGSRLRDW
ncbi:hypothetical protein [Prosthecodimorpha staleyi]|uniref:Sel1 repeat family protein n=1 Tax=Prosthecodimorpha staleyi TaxID=2840188 RepID=A0A947DAX2_9HYPH|nr:hypothetical protein [Prosthecodimorpha staleyi]MBT9291907.1 hypothetical protein [Prosthecodimorpha staleyi]